MGGGGGWSGYLKRRIYSGPKIDYAVQMGWLYGSMQHKADSAQHNKCCAQYRCAGAECHAVRLAMHYYSGAKCRVLVRQAGELTCAGNGMGSEASRCDGSACLASS